MDDVLSSAPAVILLISIWKIFGQFFIRSPLDNIPGPPRGEFLYVLHKSIGWGFIQNLTESYPGIAKLHGPLGHRMLYVWDPAALHHIVVKDQYIYEEAAWFNLLRFGPGLLATLGDTHRRQRKLLNPTAIGRRVGASPGGVPVELDVLAWMGRTALELIGQAGLGHSFDPLTADTPDEFATIVKSFGPSLVLMNHLRRVLPYIPSIGPPAFQAKVVELFPHRGIQGVKRFIDRLHDESLKIYRGKIAAMEKGNEEVLKQVGEGKDVMSILIRANMEASEEDRLPEEEVIAQISTFIFAAMDTTSNALALTLQELGDHPEAQDRVRAEILAALDGRETLEHDELVALPFLDAVCRETLRLHAPVTQVFRETRQDVVLPLSQPIRGVDGALVREIAVPRDTTVAIGILSANRNKAVWGEDAEAWRPERWLQPLPATVQDAKVPGIYSNLMTFLGGGRACIGFKFSQLEMKCVLCLLLAKFTFAWSDKPVTWNLSNVRFPTVGNNPKPSMPMMVGLYQPAPAPTVSA
ncbi:cytochrome P450 [Epithele typhae]|uniref:cytochrome P450 n=1 Tax=Epithele typhae TaxID=378194 RepID=UPI0020078F65|nr:cytochrome P450 [Epithele typhae]KAH9941852.1 cytochrome P450 [Epithele typhae]